MLKWTREGLRRFLGLGAGQAVPDGLEGCVVILVKEPVAPTVNTVLADLTEADFAGYARSAAVVWDDVLFELPTQASIEGPVTEFVATDAVTPNTIHAAALVHPAVVGPPAVPETLIAVEVFDTPVGVGAADEGVRFRPRVTLPL